jgi:hypothetical protein
VTVRALVIAAILGIVVAVLCHVLSSVIDHPVEWILRLVEAVAIGVAVVAGIWAAALKINRD